MEPCTRHASIGSAARQLALGVLATARLAAQTAGDPAPRAGHVMTSAGASGGVYLVGGQLIDNTPRVTDTLWAWSGRAWRALSTNGPHNRSLPAAALDSKRGVLVVYGGVAIGSGTRYGDTWEWDGHRWQERAIETPGPRDHHAMVYDESRGLIVMYGGELRSQRRYVFPNDTWTYDGDRWVLADSTTGPGGLVHHAMAYDARRQRVVLFGGFRQGSSPNGETWEWGGERWQHIPVDGPSPSARSHMRLAFDAARGVTVMFGGDESGETWTWDGTRWQQHRVPGPTPRRVHALAWDAARQRVVLFAGAGRGGVPPYDYLNDVWEWDGTGWAQVRPARSP